jgi:hypothetical protein
MLVFASGESREEKPGTRSARNFGCEEQAAMQRQANTTGSLSFRANLMTRSQEQAT